MRIFEGSLFAGAIVPDTDSLTMLLCCKQCKTLYFFRYPERLVTVIQHFGNGEVLLDSEFARSPLDSILEYLQDWIDAAHFHGSAF